MQKFHITVELTVPVLIDTHRAFFVSRDSKCGPHLLPAAKKTPLLLRRRERDQTGRKGPPLDQELEEQQPREFFFPPRPLFFGVRAYDFELLSCQYTFTGSLNNFWAVPAMASKQMLKELKDLNSDAAASCSAERMARVNAAWEAMNSGLPSKAPKCLMSKPALTGNKTTKKTTPDWMVTLGLAPKRTSATQNIQQKKTDDIKNGANEEAKKVAAAALSAAKDIASLAASAGRGKIEITEVKDFAGEDIEVKKLVDADSKEAAEKAKAASGPPSALDSILEQIRKKPKLSVLDKTKKDWGEFKDENRGLEEQLDAYKKSSNQYLDKVSFLQRADVREFERERDARLAMQSKRRTADMREDDL
ncbi:hypothetical protein Taro_045153 [Colocasia esculenta]|uniref:BCNT-C domain-containing protein n=1 Tax=Colocasia esculenta TaxID=4460 RepID=A0A843X679_COLES|nr:hypothetical protein [Colocasia esculenta]